MAVETVSRIISDQSGWEVEEENHAEMRLVFPDGTTYNIDLSTDEANTFLNGLTNKPWPEKTQASKVKGPSGKPFAGPYTPNRRAKDFAEKMDKAAEFFQKHTPAKITESLAGYEDKLKDEWVRRFPNNSL